jgi:serine/threonine protein phosphatase PrpC
LTPPLCNCGAPEGDLDEDGYCLQCGRRCRPAPGEHVEKALSHDFAAISDRGLRHHRNEDRVEIAVESGRCIAVICDGVSSSPNADVAAETVSRSVMEAVLAGADRESAKGADASHQTGEELISSWGGTLDTAPVLRELLKTAIEKASHRVVQLTAKPDLDGVPSTTIVAAVVEGEQATIAWIGDSRAYWIAPSDSRQLTTDHSWLNDVISSGELSYDEAMKSVEAHGITRWIGGDAGLESAPEMMEFQIPGPGWLLLCTDGLWNYAPEIDGLAEMLLAFPADTPALDIAGHLIAFANEKGGSDNITVALLRMN